MGDVEIFFWSRWQELGSLDQNDSMIQERAEGENVPKYFFIGGGGILKHVFENIFFVHGRRLQ